MRVVRAAVVQAAACPFESHRCVDKLRDLTADVARRGARLAVFPEAFIGGHPTSLGLDPRGRRNGENREVFRRYWESAITIPGPAIDAISSIARGRRMYLVVGAVERDEGTLYGSVLFFAPDGSYLGRNRKVMPTGPERLVWGYGDGSTMGVFNTALGRLGAVVAWDNYLPLLRTHIYAQGIQLYCAPAIDDRESWLPTLRHIALEGRCFVLSACQHAKTGDPAAELATENAIGHGGSCIIGPLGNVLACADQSGETIVVADLDSDDLARAKYDFDVIGHSARPDIFRLFVNETVMTPVVYDPPGETFAAFAPPSSPALAPVLTPAEGWPSSHA